MDKIVIKQLFSKQEIYKPRNRYSYFERSSIKIRPDHRLLFLRIFKEVRRKLKRGNQFDVAIQIKRIFNEAQEKGTFNYLSESEYKYNFETMRKETVPYTANELEIKRSLQKMQRQSFLKEIGLTEKTFNYLYGYFYLDDLINYYATATPAAIVQMKKRLAKLKS